MAMLAVDGGADPNSGTVQITTRGTGGVDPRLLRPYPGPSASPTTPAGPSAGQAAPTPLDNSPSSITTDPGSTPDWNSLITGDPGYQAAQSAAQAAAATASAQRQAQIRQALIQYGGMPSGFADAYGDVDQATLDAAKGNQYSTLANLQKGYQQSLEQFKRALAARGMVGSGDMNFGQQQIDQGYGQQQYDAANAFSGQVNPAINAYTGVLNQNAQNLGQAISQAEANQYSNPLNRPSAAKTAALDSGLSARYNRPIYSDGNGTYYTQDGNPFDPNTAPPTVQQYQPLYNAAYGGGPDSWAYLHGNQ